MNLQEAFQSFRRSPQFAKLSAEKRQGGMDFFLAKGLPSKKDEAWHYTSLKNLPETLLIPTMDLQPPAIEQLRARWGRELHPEFFNLVIWNGRWVPELSNLPDAGGAASGLTCQATGEGGESPISQDLRGLQAQVKDLRVDSMEALNSAFSASGFLIDLQPETSLAKPLHILHIQDQPGAAYPRNLVRIGKRAKLSLIESFVGLEQSSLTSAVSEILVGDSAKLEYVRVQAEGPQSTHVSRTRIYLQKNSQLDSLSYGVGAKLNRQSLDVYCLGEAASAQVNGLTLGTRDQHHDNHTLIDHVVGACTTQQLYKSILDAQSRAVFTGRVQIREKAQKASSEQLNQNLLLSSQAEADSKPELGIYADDVKATHGSTVGQLNADELFYFMSRAIARDQAVEMLSLGFVKELIDRVAQENLRNWLAAHLVQHYRQMKGAP